MDYNTLYYLHNSHGDVTYLTDSGGNTLHAYEYDAFGVEVNPNLQDYNPFRYCGNNPVRYVDPTGFERADTSPDFGLLKKPKASSSSSSGASINAASKGGSKYFVAAIGVGVAGAAIAAGGLGVVAVGGAIVTFGGLGYGAKKSFENAADSFDKAKVLSQKKKQLRLMMVTMVRMEMMNQE